MMRRRSKRRRIVAALCAALLASWSSPAAAQAWKQLRGGDLPARVRAITFANGVVLNDRTSATWGRWRLEFGVSPPVAKLRQCDPDSCPVIMIEEFRCVNPVVGEGTCLIMLAWIREANMGYCVVYPPKEAAGTEVFQIRCPVDLQLE